MKSQNTTVRPKEPSNQARRSCSNGQGKGAEYCGYNRIVPPVSTSISRGDVKYVNQTPRLRLRSGGQWRAVPEDDLKGCFGDLAQLDQTKVLDRRLGGPVAEGGVRVKVCMHLSAKNRTRSTTSFEGSVLKGGVTYLEEAFDHFGCIANDALARKVHVAFTLLDVSAVLLLCRVGPLTRKLGRRRISDISGGIEDRTLTAIAYVTFCPAP